MSNFGYLEIRWIRRGASQTQFGLIGNRMHVQTLQRFLRLIFCFNKAAHGSNIDNFHAFMIELAKNAILTFWKLVLHLKHRYLGIFELFETFRRIQVYFGTFHCIFSLVHIWVCQSYHENWLQAGSIWPNCSPVVVKCLRKQTSNTTNESAPLLRIVAAKK